MTDTDFATVVQHNRTETGLSDTENSESWAADSRTTARVPGIASGQGRSRDTVRMSSRFWAIPTSNRGTRSGRSVANSPMDDNQIPVRSVAATVTTDTQFVVHPEYSVSQSVSISDTMSATGAFDVVTDVAGTAVPRGKKPARERKTKRQRALNIQREKMNRDNQGSLSRIVPDHSVQGSPSRLVPVTQHARRTSSKTSRLARVASVADMTTPIEIKSTIYKQTVTDESIASLVVSDLKIFKKVNSFLKATNFVEESDINLLINFVMGIRNDIKGFDQFDVNKKVSTVFDIIDSILAVAEKQSDITDSVINIIRDHLNTNKGTLESGVQAAISIIESAAKDAKHGFFSRLFSCCTSSKAQ